MKTVITSNTTKVSKRYRNMARNFPGLVHQAVHDLVQTEAVPLFGKTAATFEHEPTFEAVETPRGWAVKVTPEFPYGWVNRGAKPHIIEAKNVMLLRFTGPYHAKTKPNVIASYKGGRGKVWVSKRRVHHPGIEARNFSEIILRRIQARAANKVREALNEASYGAGTGI